MRSFDRARLGEVVGAHRLEQGDLQIGDDAAGAGQQAVAASTRELISQALCVVSTVTARGRFCSARMCARESSDRPTNP